MTLEDLKTEIEQRAGIPATLLNGESAEEIIAHAKALNAYRKGHKADAPKDTRTKFAEWLNQTQGQPETDPAGEAINDLEEELRVANGGYPYMNDAGEVTDLGDGRPPKEQFAEWFGQKTAFNPFNHSNWNEVI